METQEEDRKSIEEIRKLLMGSNFVFMWLYVGICSCSAKLTVCKGVAAWEAAIWT